MFKYPYGDGIKVEKPVSLIILVHQEADVIEGVIKDFYEKVTSKILDSEFIVCEDGSTDGTKEILLNIKDKYNLTLNMGNNKKGYTQAMKEAFALAKNDIIFFSDSDGQHEPDDFWKMYPLMDDYDMVIGWKINRKDSWFRLLITKIFNDCIAIYFGVKLHDIDCGFRLIKKNVINFLLAQNWRLKHCVNSELTVKACKAGFKVTEVPVSHFPRTSGESRGLPINKLPSIITHILSKFPEIKKDIKTLKKGL